jgi:hypothetical protein
MVSENILALMKAKLAFPIKITWDLGPLVRIDILEEQSLKYGGLKQRQQDAKEKKGGQKLCEAYSTAD